jgi:nucleotide-binding universal stress UspA family protein
MRYVLPRVVDTLARSQELLLGSVTKHVLGQARSDVLVVR